MHIASILVFKMECKKMHQLDSSRPNCFFRMNKKMKNKLIPAVTGVLILGLAAPVFAGPDFPAIEQARKAKRMSEAARVGDAPVAAPAKIAPQNCPPQPLVLPPDHGPRARSTPHLNRVLTARFDAQTKACKAAS